MRLIIDVPGKNVEEVMSTILAVLPAKATARELETNDAEIPHPPKKETLLTRKLSRKRRIFM